MELQGRFILHEPGQSGKHKQSKQAKLPQRKRNDLSEIVLNKEQLWIRSSANQAIQELRNQELVDIIEKQRNQT